MGKKKKILIAGLLGAYGGRELEAAFITQILEPHYEVSLLSTVNVHPDSDIYAFGFTGPVNSLNKLVYDNNFWVRITTKLMYAFRKKIRENHFHISNKLTRFLLDLDTVKHRVLYHHLKSFDAVLICAQLHSKHMKALVMSAEKLQIPTIFRTTGTIDLKAVKQHEWLNHVSHFIHHSEANASQLKHISGHFYTRIDQCAFHEPELIKMPVVSEKIRRFLCLGRLDKNKNIETVITAFKHLQDPDLQLTIVGSGHEKKKLQAMAASDKRIVFKSNISHEAIAACYQNHDCLIIASKEESGPLTAIEAMAAGRMIVSTKVGAMPERLLKLPFWFDGSSENLVQIMNKVMRLSGDEVREQTQALRNVYLDQFSKKEIQKQYLATIEAIV